MTQNNLQAFIDQLPANTDMVLIYRRLTDVIGNERTDVLSTTLSELSNVVEQSAAILVRDNVVKLSVESLEGFLIWEGETEGEVPTDPVEPVEVVKPVKPIQFPTIFPARTPGKFFAMGVCEGTEIRTSHIVNFDIATGRIETLNTIYVINTSWEEGTPDAQ